MSIEKLNKIIESGIPKIYILDIEIPNSKSGLDVARKIRENDWESEIIFITSHDKMFETAYRNVYEIFDFIEKFHHLESNFCFLDICLKKNKLACYVCKGHKYR